MYTESFIEFARCKKNTEIDFHSEDISMIKTAVAFCQECPVKEQCLGYALSNNILYGVWGGATAYQRKKLIQTAKKLKSYKD